MSKLPNLLLPTLLLTMSLAASAQEIVEPVVGDVAWIDDTRYYLLLDEGVDTPEVLTDDAMTWRYNGQHVFSAAPMDDEPAEWVVPDEVLTGMDPDPDAYFGVGHAIRVDSLGREWVLEDVDVARVEEKRRAYDALVEDLFGVEPGARAEATWEVPDNAGEVETVVPVSWSKWNCGSSGWYVFEPDSDPLYDVAAPMNGRQRKMMFLADDNAVAVPYCSGVMVDEDTILTAAHCTATPANSQYWCSMENLDENIQSGGIEPSCHQGDFFDPAPGWVAPPDLSGDYALVHLVDGPGQGWMPLSSSTDEITEYPDYVRGYPRKAQDCSSGDVTDTALTTDDSLLGRVMMGGDGMVQTELPDYVKWDTAGARGMSGSPHFYCPSGSCASGHWVTGVFAYALMASCPGTGNPESCPTGASAGPRAAAIRDWVIANM